MKYLSKMWLVCAPMALACAEEREPISASTLALTAQQNVERALRGVHAAGSFLADSGSLAKLLSGGGESCQDDPIACQPGQVCTPETTCTDSVTVGDLEEGREDAAEAIDELVKKLKEDVFTAENLESEDGQVAVYRLSAAAVCRSDSPQAPSNENPPTDTDTPMLDAECVEQMTELQPRLRLSSPRDGDVDVALLLTAERRNPATLQLHANSVGVQVDLGELKATLDATGQDTGELASMSGKLAFELTRNSELDYSFRFNVLSTLSVNTVDDLMQQIAITLGGNTPSAELRLDGNARQVTGSYHFGAFNLKGPLNALYSDDPAPSTDSAPQPEKTYTGLIELLVGGLDGSITFDGNQDRLALKAVGLGNGSSTLKHEGQLLAQLDVNRNSGRHFDLTIERTSEEQTTLTFAPGFDVDLLLNFAPLQNQISDIPRYALDDRLRFSFSGTNPAIRLEPEQMRVLSGTLQLTSQSTPAANITVQAGACLLESEATEPEHELLGGLTSGSCQ